MKAINLNYLDVGLSGFRYISRILNNCLTFCILCAVAGFVTYLYFKRVVNPDVAFDTINYHFLIGKLGYDNFPQPFNEIEFFPLGFHSFNPIIDMLSYIVYQIAGYRFGTLLSLLSVLGIYLLIPGIVRKITGENLTFIAKLFLIPALVVNEAFFQLGTYFTDNIYSFLIILYFSLSLSLYEKKNGLSLLASLVLLGVIAGAILTKLTNVVYLVPLIIVSFYEVFVPINNSIQIVGRNRLFLFFIIAVVVFSIPVVIITGYHFSFVFLHTGNPVFPFYNSIFQSPFFPLITWEFNFGPKTLYEKIFYPYFVFNNPVLLGEVKDLFPDLKLVTGLLSLSSILLLFKFLKVRWSSSERVLFVVAIISYCLWQLLFGYSRYGIALEFLIGLSLVVVVNKAVILWGAGKLKHLVIFISFIFLYLFFSQAKEILDFNRTYDIAWRPPVSYEDWEKNVLSSDIFNKYTVISSSALSEFKKVDVIVQCVNPSSAYAATIPELMGKPMINFDKGSNGGLTLNDRYIEARDGRVDRLLTEKGADSINFAIVFNDTNKGLKSREGCMNAIALEKEKGRILSIKKEFMIDNFVGDKKQVLTVFLGSYDPRQRY